MSFQMEVAAHVVNYDGATHYFCSGGCKTKFLANPEQYLSGAYLDAAEDPPEGTIYTCPMHPEIRQEGPGTCPICGMALEPETVSLDEGPDPELVDMSRRFWWSAPFTVQLFLYAMSDMVLLDLHRIVDPVRAKWNQIALDTPVLLREGVPVFVGAGPSL